MFRSFLLLTLALMVAAAAGKEYTEEEEKALNDQWNEIVRYERQKRGAPTECAFAFFFLIV